MAAKATAVTVNARTEEPKRLATGAPPFKTAPFIDAVPIRQVSPNSSMLGRGSGAAIEDEVPIWGRVGHSALEAAGTWHSEANRKG